MPPVAERERTESIGGRLADREGALRGIDQLYTDWGSTSPVGRERDRYQQALLENDVVILDAGMATGKSTLGMPLALEALLKKYEYTKGIATEPTKQLMRETADTLGRKIGTQYVHHYHRGRAPDPASRLEVTGFVSLSRQFIRDKKPHREPMLSDYNFVFLDEAHKLDEYPDLLPRIKEAIRARSGTGKPLKAILASGTMDAEGMEAYFTKDTNLKVGRINVEGRVHPLETKFLKKEEAIRPEHIPQKATETLIDIITNGKHPGDILSFIPGKKGIQDVESRLLHYFAENDIHDIEIITLFGGEEGKRNKEKIDKETAKRRIYLATTVVQEGANIPRVRYAIVCGRTYDTIYDPKTGLSFTEEVDLTQDAAWQQAYRAPREQAGTVYFLMTEEQVNTLKKHKDTPTDLTKLVLRLKDNGVDDVYTYDYKKIPPREHLEAAEKTLQKLGALDNDMKITKIGRLMAAEEDEPRYARMLVEADKPIEGETDAQRKNIKNAVAILKGLMEYKGTIFTRRTTPEMEHNTSDFISALYLWNEFIRTASIEDEAQRKKGLDDLERNYHINPLAFMKAADVRRETMEEREVGYSEITWEGNTVNRIMECVLAGTAPWIMRSRGTGYELANNPEMRFDASKSSHFYAKIPKEMVSGKFSKNSKTGRVFLELSQELDEDMLKRVTEGYYAFLQRPEPKSAPPEPESKPAEEPAKVPTKPLETRPPPPTNVIDIWTREPVKPPPVAFPKETKWQRFKDFLRTFPRRVGEGIKKLWQRFLGLLRGKPQGEKEDQLRRAA